MEFLLVSLPQFTGTNIYISCLQINVPVECPVVITGHTFDLFCHTTVVINGISPFAESKSTHHRKLASHS